MSFIFPIISTISMTIICGYILYQYVTDYSKKNIKKSKKKMDNTQIDQDDQIEQDDQVDTIQNNNKSNIIPSEYRELDSIIIEPIINRPTLIVPNKIDYTPISSNEEDFDIRNIRINRP